MAADTNYYIYDSSQRMSRQWAGTAVEAYYFRFDQQNRVSRVSELSSSMTQYLDYNGVSDRLAIRREDPGTTSASYMSYDGAKLLRELRNDGAVLGRYRHNQGSQLAGSTVEVTSSGEAVGTTVPSFDERGSLVQLSQTGSVAYYSYDRFGNTVQAGATNRQRERFLSPGMLDLDRFQQQMYVTEASLWLPKAGVAVAAEGPIVAPQDNPPQPKPERIARFAALFVASNEWESEAGGYLDGIRKRVPVLRLSWRDVLNPRNIGIGGALVLLGKYVYDRIQEDTRPNCNLMITSADASTRAGVGDWTFDVTFTGSATSPPARPLYVGDTYIYSVTLGSQNDVDPLDVKSKTAVAWVVEYDTTTVRIAGEVALGHRTSRANLYFGPPNVIRFVGAILKPECHGGIKFSEVVIKL